jgi:hypothetical protein
MNFSFINNELRPCYNELLGTMSRVTEGATAETLETRPLEDLVRRSARLQGCRVVQTNAPSNCSRHLHLLIHIVPQFHDDVVLTIRGGLSHVEC